MNNFEKTIENNNTAIDKELLNRLNFEVEKYIKSKINKFIIILEGANFNYNKAERRLDKKVEELKDELKNKFFSKVYIDNIDEILKRRIIKLSLENIAEKKLNNSLSFYKNLEEKYSQILLDEAEFYLENNLISSDKKELIKFLNQSKILDNSAQGDLINQLEKKYE